MKSLKTAPSMGFQEFMVSSPVEPYVSPIAISEQEQTSKNLTGTASPNFWEKNYFEPFVSPLSSTST